MPYSHAVPKLVLLLAVLAGACEREGRLLGPAADGSMPGGAHRVAEQGDVQWSAPINPGAPINTPFLDQNPSLSSDGLALYFASDRPGGLGQRDLYVAHRATRRSPWQTPVNIGSTVNSSADEIAPHVSSDGRLLFFASTRPGGFGRFDLYVSRRTNRRDDSAWEPPINLGPRVNTADPELGPTYLARAAEGEDGNDDDENGIDHEASSEDADALLYFSRGVQAQRASDIYVATVSRAGEVRAPATIVSELSVPGANDAAPSVRRDGREIFFWSDRPGSAAVDLWTSTRRRAGAPWSEPMQLGTPPNSAFDENGPSLSADARSLFFTADRPGGQGSLDIWLTTRSSRSRR